MLIAGGVACAAEKKSAWSPELKVGLIIATDKVTLNFSAPCNLTDLETGKVIAKIPAGKSFVVKSSELKTSAAEIRPQKIALKDLQTTVNGKIYFGGIRFIKVKNLFNVINLVPVEEYLHGVLSKEMSPDFPIEALKAQAVAARSFAMKNRGKHELEGFDICATVHCQVYDGVISHWAVNKAVEETRGEIMTFGGKIADTNFHADSGGMTESVRDVWGTATPYLIAVREIINLSSPWIVKVPLKDFSSRFGDGFGDLKLVKLSKMSVGQSADDRTSSGRVKTARLVGSNKTVDISGSNLRRKFSLPSTLFDITVVGNEVIFRGYGRGHGVGMSQMGAKSYAEDGWSYRKILEHYYSGAELKKVY